MDCFVEDTCFFLKKGDVATKLVLHEMAKNDLVQQAEVDAITDDISMALKDSCITNKVAYITAYWFDLPEPTPASGKIHLKTSNIAWERSSRSTK